MRSPLLATSLLALALALPAAAAERQITVTGSATVDAAPDRATISAGVETQAPSAAAAMAANTEAMTKVVAAIAAAGIDKRDVQTSQLNLNPVFSPDPGRSDAAPQVVAYQAANSVTVRVRDVAGLGGVIDALTTAGANRLYGIGFDVDDPRPVLDTARKHAVEDARGKAELLAAAAGVKLGPVVSISEGGNPGPAPMMARMAAEAAPPVEAGSVTLSADVTIVYALE